MIESDTGAEPTSSAQSYLKSMDVLTLSMNFTANCLSLFWTSVIWIFDRMNGGLFFVWFKLYGIESAERKRDGCEMGFIDKFITMQPYLTDGQRSTLPVMNGTCPAPAL